MSFIKKLSEKLGKSKPNNAHDTPNGVNLAFSSYGGNPGSANVLPPKPSEGSNFIMAEHRLGKPGGGWADDDDNYSFSKPSKVNPSSNEQSQNYSVSTQFQKGPVRNEIRENNINQLLEPEDLSEKNIEYEMKLVSDIIQPGGARIKPSNAILQEFTKNCSNLQSNLMTSVLLYVIETEIPASSKAKAFFAIEHLIRNNSKYLKMFELGISRIENVPDDTQFSGDPNFQEEKEDKYAGKLAKNIEKNPDSNDLLAIGEKKKGFKFIGNKNQNEDLPQQEETKKKGFGFIGNEKKEKSVEPPTFDLLSHVMNEPEKRPEIQAKSILLENPPLITQQPPINLYAGIYYPQPNVPFNPIYNNGSNGMNLQNTDYNFQRLNQQPINSLHTNVEPIKEKDPKEAAFDFISF